MTSQNIFLVATEGRILYNIITDAFRRSKTILKLKSKRSILVWYDTLQNADYFSKLQPWQVVNRIPSINLICRKAPFIRLIQKMQNYYPKLYNFIPKSFILPLKNDEFAEFFKNNKRKCIIKPDDGALGAGIIILNENAEYTPINYLAIGQEYIESCLIDNTKFDCRIYVLIASINPLRVYVYRGGIARFCSMEAGSDDVYSQLTNTAINIKNENAKIENLTRMVTDVFEVLEKKGVDIHQLWKKIDSVIVLTIISVYNYLLEAESKNCPSCGYSRCFQILGFDILIDNNYEPIVLEVNYRPSLKSDTPDEKNMKIEMLSEAIKIAAPLNCIQDFINSTNIEFNTNGWNNFMYANHWLARKIHQQRKINLNESHFVQIFPSSDPKDSIWYDVINKVKSMDCEMEQKYTLPSENPKITEKTHLPSIHAKNGSNKKLTEPTNSYYSTDKPQINSNIPNLTSKPLISTMQKSKRIITKPAVVQPY